MGVLNNEYREGPRMDPWSHPEFAGDLLSHSFWRLVVQDQGARRFGFF